MRNLSSYVAAAIALAGLSVPAALASSTVTVTAASPNGWAFNSNDSTGAVITDSNHIGGFVNGPATPPLGTGSAQLKIINGAGDGSEQLRNGSYVGTPLSSLTALSYSTYAVTNNGQQMPYLSLYISTDGSGVYDDKLTFEPPYQTPSSGNPSLPNQGASTLNTWQTWNALAGGWYDDITDQEGTGVQSLASFEATYPNATLVNSGGLGGLRVAVGYSSPGDNYEGYIDNLSIGVSGNTTTYDFEPAATPEPASLSLLVAGAMALLTRRRRSA